VAEADALYVIAQVAIGIAGFTGIVTALRGQGDLHPADVARTVGLIAVAANLIALSLLPVVLYALGVAGAPLWRASSALGLGLGVATLAVMQRFQAATRLPYQRFFPVIGAALSLLALANIAVGSFGLFYLHLVASLVVGVLQFAHILLVRPDASTIDRGEAEGSDSDRTR
jgi:hypothetical protein